MSDPIEDRIRQIEALIGEAASVAHRYKMRKVDVSHLLYVLAGTPEGGRIIEELGGNQRRLRTFLEQSFLQHRAPGILAGGTEIDESIHEVATRRFNAARQNGRVPQLRDIFQEMIHLKDRSRITREALIVAGIIEDGARRSGVTEIIDETGRPGHDDADNPFAGQEDEDDEEAAEAQSAAGVDAETGAPAQEVDEHVKAVIDAMRDLTLMAQSGQLDPVVGRDDVIGQIVGGISRRRKKCVVMIGEAGIGKTAIAEGLAQFLISEKAPENLQGRPLLEISISDLVAGSRFRGDFEARLKALIEITKTRNAILFLDEMHLMVGAGAAAKGGLDAANILKPALARGELTVIGATTPKDSKDLRRDEALMRRFNAIQVFEPSPERTRHIVGEVVGAYIEHHKVECGAEILDLVIDLSARHLPTKRFPDKALDVVDLACNIAASRGAPMVEAMDVRMAIERSGGSRLTPPSPEERERLKNLEEVVSNRVFGQEEAVKVSSQAVRASFRGIGRGGVAGSYLFNGPSGSGKTELAIAIADALALPIVRIDMSEYMEKHSVSRLIGAPPGYVGFDQDGQLVEAGEKYQDFILLFDEADKAHPDVFDILLQVLDYGMFRSGSGQLISLKRAHVILSCNFGHSQKDKAPIGFSPTRDDKTKAAEQKAEAAEKIEDTFRKEFLRRIRFQIHFNEVGKDIVLPIVEKELKLARRDYADRGIEVTFSDDVAAWVAGIARKEKIIDGRAVQDAIDRLVHEKMSDLLLENDELQKAHFSLEGEELLVA